MEKITMKNLNLKKFAVLVLVFALLLMTTACGAGQTVSDASSDTQPSQTANGTSEPAAEPQSFRIGICNYVDDASLNQIVENIQARLEEIQSIIAKRSANETQYDDSIVRQMIECIKVHRNGMFFFMLGSAYEIEETL